MSPHLSPCHDGNLPQLFHASQPYLGADHRQDQWVVHWPMSGQ